MSKKSPAAAMAKAKPPAGKFTPGDKKGPPKRKDAEQIEQEAAEKAAAGGEGAPDFAKEPADPKSGKPPQAPKAEKAPKEPKAPKAAKEPAPPRGLSPKMDQMLKLAMSDAGLTHKDIVAITGSPNPPQTQLVERLRKHVEGTLEKVRPEGARGFTYKITPGKAVPAPTTSAPTTDAASDTVEGSEEQTEGEGEGTADGGFEEEGADTVAGSEAAAA